jgi:signal transduction histidine kinase
MRVVRAIEDVNRAVEREQVQRLLDASAGPEALELLVEVAHDVRSPLGAILLLVETIRTGRSGALTPVQERQLGLVYGAAFNLNEMVNNVVALAREGDRLIEREPIAFSVSEILQAVREIVRPIAEEKGLELRFTPPDVDWRVGHPTAISRVLLNLVTNALRETDQGFVDVGCRTLSRTRLEFFVRDTGRGIDPALREALFRAFHVEQSGKVRFSSSGLGLTICRKLIDAMHGELTVDAAPGGGSRFAFEIELPLAERL